jgi:hypothetical protein
MADRYLAAIGEARLESRGGLPVDDADVFSGAREPIGRVDADDTGTEHNDVEAVGRRRHLRSPSEAACAQAARQAAPSVIDLRVSPTPFMGGGLHRRWEPDGSTFQSVSRQAVLLPESFRGGCSFGASQAQSAKPVSPTCKVIVQRGTRFVKCSGLPGLQGHKKVTRNRRRAPLRFARVPTACPTRRPGLSRARSRNARSPASGGHSARPETRRCRGR